MSLSGSGLAHLHTDIANCRKCVDAGYFAEHSLIVVNQPERMGQSPRLMLVGQAPASAQRSAGRPFSGQAGRVLFGWLAQAGWAEEDFRARCYFSAITKCYPGPAKGGVGRGDRLPTPKEQALCQPFLQREMEIIRPEIIITVGRLAMTYFLGAVDFTATIGAAYLRAGRTILPLPHPSGVSRWNNAPENQARVQRALAKLRGICSNGG